jgi:hypothetical protein
MLLITLLAACIPATWPPPVSQQPGPGVRITDQLYVAPQFQAEYPDGWTVVTSAAADPLHVIFAAPGGEALIMLGEQIAEAPVPAGAKGPLDSESRDIRLPNGSSIRAILHAPVARWSYYEPFFESVLASIRLPQR